MIKTMLVRHQVEFPKTHDISQLRNLVLKVDTNLSKELELADILTPYGVEFRYPGDFAEMTRQQAENAFQIAQHVKHLVMNRLKPYLDQGRPEDSATATEKTR